MFNFENNDCSLCIPSDIDFSLEETKDMIGDFDEIIKLNFRDNSHIDMNCDGIVQINRIYYNIRDNKLLPYFYAGRFMARNNFDESIITTFLKSVESDDSLMTVYKGHKNTSMDYTNFVYGVDEYFTNKILLDYVVREKRGLSIYIEFDILSPLEKLLKLWNVKLDKNKYKKMMGYILGKKYYKKDPKESYLILEKQRENPQIIERLIKYYILTYSDKYEYDYLERNIIDVCTNDLFLGTIKFKGYISYNNPEYNIIVNYEESLPKFSKERLVEFKDKYHVKDLFKI